MLKRFKDNKLKYILFTSAIIFILVSFGLFWPTGGANAQAGSSITNFFANIIGNFLFWIVQLLASLLVGVIQIMVGVAKYNNFINATAVVKGWVIVRDVCNMFFIGVLLVIAFGTIFKWETYRYNKLLGRLILMAFLINFSKFICGFFIDIFQVLMLTFVNSFADVAAGNFVESLQLQEMLQMRSEMGAQVAFTGIVGAMLLAILLLTIAVVTIGAMLVVFLMRILMLWLLVVLSPLAFLLKTWPGAGERYSSQWWSNFGKYLTAGPVLAFFIWLSLSIMTSSAGNLGKSEGFEINTEEQKSVYTTESTGLGGAAEEVGAAAGARFGSTITKISETENLLSFIIAISLLVGSLMMSQKMGVMGGQVTGAALGKITGGLKKVATLGAAAVGGGAIAAGVLASRKKIATAGGYLGGRGKKVAARKLIHDDGAMLRKFRWTTPTFWKGFAKRGETLDEVALQQTLGKGEGFSERFFKGEKAAMPLGDYATMDVINKQRREYQEKLAQGGNTRQEMQDMGLRALATGGHEGHIKKMAFMSMITSKGNWDDLWESIAQEINKDPNFAKDKKIPPEVVELLQGGYHETSAGALAASFMGLDRNKFDPNAIRQRMLSEATGEEGVMAAEILKEDEVTGMDATLSADRYDSLSPEQRNYLDRISIQAENEAKMAGKNADEKDRMALRTMSMSGIEARETGHWEQLFAVPEPGTGRSYMILPVGTPGSSYNEATGEAEKIGTRKFIGTMNPYLMFPKWFDPKMGEEGDFRFRTDPRYQTRYQREWMQGMVTPEMFRDFHHQAKRMPKQFLGIRSKVGAEDANFDDDGAFFNGEEQFNYDEETDTYSINESKMDSTMEHFREDGESRGYTGDKLSRFMMRKRRDLSHDRAKATRDLAPATFDAYYRLGYYGDARENKPVPFNMAWDGVGESFSDKILDNPETYNKRVNDNAKRAEKEAEEKYHDDPVKLAEKKKYIEVSAAAAKEYYAEAKSKKKKKMADVNEGRQNATREKVEEQGAAFFNSEEYKNNSDAYYDEDTYNNNEGVVQALKNQSDVNKMTGMKTALSNAGEGKSAALAVNFDDEALSGLNLSGAGANLRGEEMTGAIEKIGDKYLENLIRENEDKADEDKKTEEQMVEEVEEFKKNLGNASSLRLVNKGRAGVDVRHILTHEKYHDQIDSEVDSGNLNLEDEWNAMNEEEQKDVREQLQKQGWDVNNMDTADIMKEYMAEGLTNQTKYAQAGGTKLKGVTFASLQGKGMDVKGEAPMEVPEIEEIEEAPDLRELQKDAIAKKVTSTIGGVTGASKIRSWWKDRKKNKETEAIKEEGLEELEESSKIGKEAAILTGQRDTKSQQRKKEEQKLAELKKQEAPAIAALNKKIKESSEKAREEAAKGNVSGAKQYHTEADKARKEAMEKSERIRAQEEGVQVAKKEEAEAAAKAKEASDKTKASKEKVDQTVERGERAAYGGEAGYQKHIKEEVESGIEGLGRAGYKNALQQKIDHYKGQLGKGGEIEYEARIKIGDAEKQLAEIEGADKKKGIDYYAKVDDAGGFEKYEEKLKKNITNLENRIKVAPDDEKVKLEADADGLRSTLSTVQNEMASIDTEVNLGIKNAGGLDQFSKQLDTNIKNAQKELEKAPDEKKQEVQDRIDEMQYQRTNVGGRKVARDEGEARKQAEEERKAKADAIREEAREMEEQAKAMETGDTGKAKQLHRAAEKRAADAKKLESKPVEFEGATDEMKEKEEKIKQLESKNAELMEKRRELIGKPGSTKKMMNINKELYDNKEQITAISSELPEGMAKALKDREEKIEQFREEAERLEKEATAIESGSPERATQLRKEAAEKVKVADKVETEELKIKPVIKKEDLDRFEIPAELDPIFEQAAMQDAMRHASATEAEMAMPEAGTIDTHEFDHMVGEMARTVETMETTMKDAAKEMGTSQSVAADDFVKKLTDGFNQKAAQHSPDSPQTRPDQYLLLYEFRRMITELRNLRQSKQNLTSPAPATHGKSGGGERGDSSSSGGSRRNVNTPPQNTEEQF